VTLRKRLLEAAPEVVLLLFGAALRLRLHAAFNPRWGYDVWEGHLAYIRFVAAHGSLPPPGLNSETFNPPLYYWIAAHVMRAGLGVVWLQWMSIASAIARLVVLALGLRLALPRDRRARLTALALAAVLPCALHADGMVTNESLQMLWGTCALFALLSALRSSGRRRALWSAVLAVVLALMVWTKASGLVLVALTAAAALLDYLCQRGTWRARLRGAAPLALASLAALALSLPGYALRNRSTGHLIVTSFDSFPNIMREYEPYRRLPLWERRPLRYVFGLGHGALVQAPYYPNDVDRFLPTVIASTFGDYYNYLFSGTGQVDETTVEVNTRPMRASLLPWLRASCCGGAVIGLATLIAWLATLVRGLRARDPLVALLAAPALALLAQLSFAIQYPVDDEGPVKGLYLQFAAAPLFGLFGIAVSACWRHSRWSRLVALLLLAALLAVALYSVHALDHSYRHT
jgi:hypothetical protein